MKITTKMKLVAIGAASLLLVACGSPTLDTSSAGAFEKSSAAIVADLNEEEQLVFSAAFTRYGMKAMMSRSSADIMRLGANPHEAYAGLDGLTADEIIEKANKD